MLSFHALTWSIRVCSGKLFWKKSGKDWTYDFHTLKWTKSEIFWNWAKHLRVSPGWIFLVGKCLVVVVLMFGLCLVGFSWILRHLPLPSQLFPCYALQFWSIWGRLDGSEAPGRVPANICWLENSLISFSLMFGRILSWFLIIWDNFFLVTFHCLYVWMAIWDFLEGTLRRKLLLDRIRSGVAWIFRPGSFLIKCSHFMSQREAKELFQSIYFKKSREKIESTISTL